MNKILVVLVLFLFSGYQLFAAGMNAGAAQTAPKGTASQVLAFGEALSAAEQKPADLEQKVKEATSGMEGKKLSLKEKIAVKLLKKQIEKIKSPADEITNILRIVGLVLIVVGLVGLLLSLLGIGYLGAGLGTLILGLILYLLSKVL